MQRVASRSRQPERGARFSVAGLRSPTPGPLRLCGPSERPCPTHRPAKRRRMLPSAPESGGDPRSLGDVHDPLIATFRVGPDFGTYDDASDRYGNDAHGRFLQPFVSHQSGASAVPGQGQGACSCCASARGAGSIPNCGVRTRHRLAERQKAGPGIRRRHARSPLRVRTGTADRRYAAMERGLREVLPPSLVVRHAAGRNNEGRSQGPDEALPRAARTISREATSCPRLEPAADLSSPPVTAPIGDQSLLKRRSETRRPHGHIVARRDRCADWCNDD
jgi:hypothetical protein